VRSSHNPDAITVSFDDDHAVADAGLILAATLAEGLMLGELVNEHVDLGSAPGAANAGDKAMTLIHSALAGGEWIEDADRLRAGSTGQVLGHRVAAPSTLGTFLRSFTWGSARQLDRVAGIALARAWQAGAGPGPWPLTIDIDSTHCETYGLHKQGATGVDRHGERGYHPLLASVAGSGDVLHSRLREGVANSGRGAGSFVTETINRARRAGASGPITLRADSGFYNHKVVQACRKAGATYSITVKVNKAVRAVIAAIAEDAWTPIPYWLEGGADVAETSYRPSATRSWPWPACAWAIPPAMRRAPTCFRRSSEHRWCPRWSARWRRRSCAGPLPPPLPGWRPRSSGPMPGWRPGSGRSSASSARWSRELGGFRSGPSRGSCLKRPMIRGR
jgi:hypothetical protein